MMILSNNKKKVVIVIIFIVLVCILVWCTYSSNYTQRENMANLAELTHDDLTMKIANQNINQGIDDDDFMLTYNASLANDSDGYKYSSYAKGNRLQDDFTQLAFFDNTTPLGYHSDSAGQDGFAPIDESGNQATYVPGDKQNETIEDKFNVSELLPKSSNKDWFDNPHDVMNVKSSRLINLHRPIGINTVQNTLRNGSRDLRGTPPNPKFPVSPWNNSSYEPDTNIRGNMLN